MLEWNKERIHFLSFHIIKEDSILPIQANDGLKILINNITCSIYFCI